MAITVRELLERKSPVMISLYMPTYRTSPDREQNEVRYRNLVDEVRSQVGDGEGASLVEQLEELGQDTEFWQDVKEGLAVFVDDQGVETVKLAVELPERVVVGERFHILPLINYFDIFTEYYLLDLSKDRFALNHFDSEGISPVDLDGVETRFDDLFDDRDVKDGNINRTDGAASNLHGHQTSSSVEERETEKFMRHIGTALSGKTKGQDGLPLIVFGTTENVADFEEVTKNTLDIFLSIDKPLGSMDEKEAIAKLREYLLPPFIKGVEEEVENLEISLGQDDQGSDNISRIGQEAEQGRIKTLLLKKDYQGIEPDRLDKVVADVILAAGDVVTVDEDYVKFDHEVGAIYRY